MIEGDILPGTVNCLHHVRALHGERVDRASDDHEDGDEDLERCEGVLIVEEFDGDTVGW